MHIYFHSFWSSNKNMFIQHVFPWKGNIILLKGAWKVRQFICWKGRSVNEATNVFSWAIVCVSWMHTAFTLWCLWPVILAKSFDLMTKKRQTNLFGRTICITLHPCKYGHCPVASVVPFYWSISFCESS